jgi:hypothetical protein
MTKRADRACACEPLQRRTNFAAAPAWYLARSRATKVTRPPAERLNSGVDFIDAEQVMTTARASARRTIGRAPRPAGFYPRLWHLHGKLADLKAARCKRRNLGLSGTDGHILRLLAPNRRCHHGRLGPFASGKASFISRRGRRNRSAPSCRRRNRPLSTHSRSAATSSGSRGIPTRTRRTLPYRDQSLPANCSATCGNCARKSSSSPRSASVRGYPPARDASRSEIRHHARCRGQARYASVRAIK